MSNINGEYEIKLPEGGVDLVFSYVGYEDVLMPIVINKREVITKDVYMKESTKLLPKPVRDKRIIRVYNFFIVLIL